MVDNGMKLPLFHGNETNDYEQYWFICEVVWTVKHATDDDIKKGQLVTTLWGCVLDWYIIQVRSSVTIVRYLDITSMIFHIYSVHAHIEP